MLYIYKVKKDESLQDVCIKYSVFKDDLLSLNNITEENVREGLLLVIDIPDGKRYVVKPFDTITKIITTVIMKRIIISDHILSLNHILEASIPQNTVNERI